ncbi:6-carboxytetrahydropterin synthase [Xylophilus sp. GOD-11R]|uniref:6-pyruvoyl trahydropterin synthase family protein n=1 Tax=Xylophilus sp. GOD-11R TaxID=3089814 RepID=UPI00298C5666|nr:6-carboxytetrahydropterin synthase [Xylophilus sp. GOD-11R]WPB57856.1 6-carboxytetrahydropterin synthase [Xylophilus sp. GOD-11R]
MRFEVSQEFYFDAAHTLERKIEAVGSRRVHGHTYHARAVVFGSPDPATGMVVDLGQLRQCLQAVREQLDHHLLDEVPGLGAPTMENLCLFIARKLHETDFPVHAVEVWRQAGGDRCRLELSTEDRLAGL